MQRRSSSALSMLVGPTEGLTASTRVPEPATAAAVDSIAAVIDAVEFGLISKRRTLSAYAPITCGAEPRLERGGAGGAAARCAPACRLGPATRWRRRPQRRRSRLPAPEATRPSRARTHSARARQAVAPPARYGRRRREPRRVIRWRI